MDTVYLYNGDLPDDRLANHLRACLRDDKPNDLSVDCEMMGLKPHRDRLCLVQICDPLGQVSLVQITQGQTTAPNLKKLLEHPDITKIFHFARADVAHLRHQLSIEVAPLFCTKIASKLARTYTERHGLRDAIRELVGADINKQQQSSDWGKSVLSQEQIEYAAGDVIHLIQLKAKLTEMLTRENNRLILAERCFAQISLMSELDVLGYEYVFEHHPPK